MKRWLMGICMAALLLCLPGYADAAQIDEDNTVFVAGNPDMFPYEYFDAQTNRYCGIFPQLYERIAEETGLEFVYIRPGFLNYQKQLAKNKQVELISAHIYGQNEYVTQELVLLECDHDMQICIGFTEVAPEELRQQLQTYLDDVTDQQLLDMAVHISERQPEWKVYFWSAVPGAVLLLAVAILTVIILRERAEKKKKNQTRFVDALTGIGNAAYFENTFKQFVTNTNHALYFVGYISFEAHQVEQKLGTAETEEIQRFAADVLSRAAADTDFVARTAEGVFLLAYQAPSEEAASGRITELLDQLNSYEEKYLGDHPIMFRAGVFWLNAPNISAETAIFNARQGYNVALHRKIPHIFTDKKLLNRETTKIELQRKLADALQNREFLLYLQMIVDPQGRIVGAEALSRWQSKENGLLSPAVFIEPLKSAGFVDRLDFCILEEVCSQLEQWSNTDRSHLWISCNFTRLTVSRSDFLVRFQQIVERYQFDKSHLVIELTEDSLMDNTAVAYRNILECQKIGCRIALDDMGSGYSSLQDLCDYPIDMIKIDRNLLLKSATPRGNALLRALTRLGHDLGMKVLCEGVETEAERICVCEAGCDYVQGFYFSRALPQDEANLFYARCQKQLTSEQ